MTLFELRMNLQRTIVGKDGLLTRLQETPGNNTSDVAAFLKVNIAELQMILADVELCIESRNNEVQS